MSLIVSYLSSFAIAEGASAKGILVTLFSSAIKIGESLSMLCISYSP